MVGFAFVNIEGGILANLFGWMCSNIELKIIAGHTRIILGSLSPENPSLPVLGGSLCGHGSHGFRKLHPPIFSLSIFAHYTFFFLRQSLALSPGRSAVV